MTLIDLRESVATLPAPTDAATGRYHIRLIGSDIQGSSGYYPREVIERDAKVAFPKGTKIYLDHPTEDEQHNRPERSVRKIGGYLLNDPVMESDGAYADVQFGRNSRDLIEDYREILGMSIFAKGEYKEADRDGITVREVTALIPSPMNSVDIVTAAGANGAILEALTESYKSVPSETGTAPAAATENNNRKVESRMEIEDVMKEVETIKESLTALTASLTPIIESLKPADASEVDVAAAVEAAYDKAIAAELPEKLRKAVVAEVKANPEADVDALIKDKSDLVESLRESLVQESGYVRESSGVTAADIRIGAWS